MTLGTAGHIDHGKTALVAALTGIDTDRLPQEKARGISIELGYAPLRLPGGRLLSVVDVPGHERFVRTMVAGATGIDFYLMVVAADDGVMPQTREHAAVLAALGVTDGVVAVTKCDLADPARAVAEASELLPTAAAVVPCSVRTGEGIEEVRAAVARVAADLPGRGGAADGAPTVLHVDRAFTIRGAGTVVTGTLWSGSAGRGDQLVVLPAGIRARVRSVQVHDEPAERAAAGQRVAVNLVGVEVREVGRGDVLAAPGAVEPTWILDAALDVSPSLDGVRVQVHHGTRESPARLVALGEGFWQARLERPLLARAGDRLVVRQIAPPDTLGGGVVVDPRARRHRTRPEPECNEASAERREVVARAAEAPLSAAALALEARLREAGHEPPSEPELGAAAAELPALRAAGRAVRVGRSMHAHPDAIAAVRERVEAIVAAEGQVTLARLRDELGTSRRYAQALLEHLDAARVTLRRPDDSRVLRRSR
ncbi:MAG TPA: selenocysteine-specific translation elongation factor [Solirubrobacteraceae bacterium]|nr:selenocysteine-specific translation elongation factor [Solirubrobacteraceae bacterium]